MNSIELNEPVLDDSYPVYWDYWYVCDGKPRRSDIQGTVRELKANIGAKEIRRCDIHGRTNHQNEGSHG